MQAREPIQVEIWSDVMCPFCYIGKRQFEAALADFEARDQVKVIWRSYQLDPGLKPAPGKSIYEYLAERKGMAPEQSKLMHDRVTQSAAGVGLDYRFDQVVVNNSLAAHRLLQAAKTIDRGDAVKEALFRAYFTEGRDIGDPAVLAEIALWSGVPAELADESFHDPEGAWGRRVEAEVNEARDLGSQGVPFFVFQRKYAVTGAQGEETFLRVLMTLAQDSA